MHHRKTYMYIKFRQNRVNRSVITVHTNLFALKCKLHKFAICILADFEINRPISNRYQITEKKITSRHDKRTDRHRVRQQWVDFFRIKNWNHFRAS